MRIVCLSDTHGIHQRMDHSIPDGDILLHAGDITKRGNLEDLPEVDQFFESLPHPTKLYTPGNHDWCFQKNPQEAVDQVPNAVCLIDQPFEIEGFKIWGSPWQPWFNDWAFNLERGKPLAEKWNLMPEDTDIVITHGPPRGILDWCSHGAREGCDDLRDRIFQIEPALHLFGHIHESYGQETHQGIRFVNASICNLGYRPVNEPIVIDL